MRKRERVSRSPEGRGEGSGTLPLNLRVCTASAPTLLNALQEGGGREEEGWWGVTSGLGKEGEGQAAGERLERPGERLETSTQPRLAGRRGGLGLHWEGDTPAFARGEEPSAVRPLPEPRPRLC